MEHTYNETMLKMENIIQKGMEDVRHDIRDEYQKAIVPLVDELSEIRETVIRIDERQKAMNILKWTATIVIIGIIGGGMWLYEDAVERIAVIGNKQDHFAQSNLE